MDAFLDQFFNTEVMAKYLPDVIGGLWITLALAGLVITTGIILGLVLAVIRAFQVRWLNILIVRRLISRVATAGFIDRRLFWTALCRSSAFGVCPKLVVSVICPRRLCGGNLLGRHHVSSQGPVGSRALYGA